MPWCSTQAGYADGYYNNTCILADSNNAYLDVPGSLNDPQTFHAGMVVGNNTVYAPGGAAVVTLGGSSPK